MAAAISPPSSAPNGIAPQDTNRTVATTRDSSSGGLTTWRCVRLRSRGLDPHHFGWSMGEIDLVAAACAAVNAVVPG